MKTSKIAQKTIDKFISNTSFKLGNTEIKVNPLSTSLSVNGKPVAFRYKDKSFGVFKKNVSSKASKSRINLLIESCKSNNLKFKIYK